MFVACHRKRAPCRVTAARCLKTRAIHKTLECKGNVRQRARAGEEAFRRPFWWRKTARRQAASPEPAQQDRYNSANRRGNMSTCDYQVTEHGQS